MFASIPYRFRNKLVKVQFEDFGEIDFQTYFSDKVQNQVYEVRVNLYMLLIQMALSNPNSPPTSRNKFLDHSSILNCLARNNYLKFNIQHLFSEDLTRNAKIIGEGLSRCLLINLFGVKESSLIRIKSSRRRPDFQGEFGNNKIVICESKGSFSNIQNSKKQEAKIQKELILGDLNLAILNEIGNISKIVDPPIRSEDKDRFFFLAQKTNHYIEIFKLSGHKNLVRYFELMRKRFENNNNVDFPEFSEKIELWNKLKYKSEYFEFENKRFIGNIELIEKNKFLFVGFDQKLLNVNTFEEFIDYETESIIQDDNTTKYITKDGICFIEAGLQYLEHIFPRVDKRNLKHYQENTTLLDIDNMTERNLIQFLQYIINKLKLEVEFEKKIKDKIIDFVIKYKKIEFYFEVKLYSKNQQLTYPKKIKELLEDEFFIQHKEIGKSKKIKKNSNIPTNRQILLTNRDRRLLPNLDIIIFDRNDFKKLLRNPNYLIQFITNLEK